MAVSTSVNRRTNDVLEIDVIATADGDTTTGNVAHLLGGLRPVGWLVNLLQVAAGLSLWAMTTLDATNIALTKSTAGGSGVATAQVRAILQRNR